MNSFVKYFVEHWFERNPLKYWNTAALKFRTNDFIEIELSSFFVDLCLSYWALQKFKLSNWKRDLNRGCYMFEYFMREMFLLQHQFCKIKCALKKKLSKYVFVIVVQVAIITQCHEQTAIDLIEFV